VQSKIDLPDPVKIILCKNPIFFLSSLNLCGQFFRSDMYVTSFFPDSPLVLIVKSANNAGFVPYLIMPNAVKFLIF